MTQKEQQQAFDEVKTFTELPMAFVIKNNLKQAQFITPTPIQARSLHPALQGRDILGTAQTGTGKTLAFLLPILQKLMRPGAKGLEALVLVPTRELAMQILDSLRNIGKGTGIYATLVVGGLSEQRQLESIRRGTRVIIATPGRLDDYVKRNLVDLQSVRTLVLDEADRMVDMGFLPQMRNIIKQLPKDRQTMCFSATLPGSVAHLVHEYVKDPVRVEIGSTTRTAELVALRIYEVKRDQKLSLLTHLLGAGEDTFLIFARTKHGADKLTEKLCQSGLGVGVLHGGKSQFQRTKALEGFKKGVYRILVATDVAARGIHVQGIDHVINYDIPQVEEDFIHRVGRTGRVGNLGVATTFVTPEERGALRAIERMLKRSIERITLPEGLASQPSFSPEPRQARGQAQARQHHFGGWKPRFGQRRR